MKLQIEIMGMGDLTYQIARIATAIFRVRDELEHNPSPTRRQGESDGDYYRRIKAWESLQS